MNTSFSAGLAMIFILLACSRPQTDESTQDAPLVPEEISFFTPDSIKIIGDLYLLDKHHPTLLLFHQGGSNSKAEYGPIIPRLLKKSINILAIDQRVGGQIYGDYNRTLALRTDHTFRNPYSYCDAYNNLEGALDYVRGLGFDGKIILWGSSYSASLAVQLAARRQDEVDAVLAFSPASGSPLEPCKPRQYFDQVKVPMLLLRPRSEMERGQEQFALAKASGHQTFVAENGVHGSSMLVASRTQSSTDECWKVVMDFLDKVMKNEN